MLFNPASRIFGANVAHRAVGAILRVLGFQGTRSLGAWIQKVFALTPFAG